MKYLVYKKESPTQFICYRDDLLWVEWGAIADAMTFRSISDVQDALTSLGEGMSDVGILGIEEGDERENWDVRAEIAARQATLHYHGVIKFPPDKWHRVCAQSVEIEYGKDPVTGELRFAVTPAAAGDERVRMPLVLNQEEAS